MKKFLIVLLSIICVFSMAMAVACVNNNNNNGDDNNNLPSDVTVMRGFNDWSEVILFDLNPTAFDGNFEINRDPQYIVEGDGSWKIYIHSKKVNQPNFKMAASNIKTDITDVVEFKLWVYSVADYEYSILITAFAGDDVVCSPSATVKPGANDLSFPINRALIAQSGKMITDYSISFSGIKKETTLYLDNFIAKTTTEEIQIKPEVKAVIDGIASLGTNPERSAVEAMMAQFNALSAEDKLCVTNSNRLKAAIEPFYLSDLAQAQKSDPSTWLYYDKPFGEIQVESITAGISGYSYSTEQKYGDQEGSLKVEFTSSSTYWVTLKTTALTMIDESNVEFYVYNDSDQPKAMCVGWNAPDNELLKQPLYVIESRTWTKINCPAAWLYDAGGASGGIQMCGLVTIDKNDPMLGASESPKGAMYFSAFEKRDDVLDIQRARTGEDANTLWFFDRALGLKQIESAKGEVAFYEDVKFDGQPTVGVTITGQSSNTTTKTKNFGYQFNTGDVVAMYVKHELNADYLRLRFGYYNGTWLYKGVWTLVMLPADVVNSTDWFFMEACNDCGDYKAYEYVDLNGTIYFAKAKVYSASEALNLTTVATDYEYKIGQTSFVNKAYEFQKGTYNNNPAIFNNDWYNYTYLVDNQLVAMAKSDSADNAQGKKRDTSIGLEMKTAVEITDGLKLYVVATGLVDPHFQMMSGRESGHFGTPHGTKVSTDANGFTLWEVDLTNYVGESCKYFRFWFGQQKVIPDIEQVVVRDIYFA